MTIHSIAILMLGALVILIGAALVWGVGRRFRRDLGLHGEKPEKTQEVSFIINAFQDVTRQLKEKEKELERLKALAEQRADDVESYAKNILQCVTNGVIAFDRDCRITTMNRAAEEILGIEQSVGRACTDVFGQDAIRRAVNETLEKKTPSARMEAVFDRKSGRIWLGYNTAILTDRQGTGLGVILSFSDLTEVKRLQEQMELRERLTALGEMSAGIAHELRNPMAVISGYLNLLAKKLDKKGQDVIRDIVAEIIGMNRIIGDLLTFARPAALNRVNVNMREMIEGCLSTMLQAKGADTHITTALSLDDVVASVDEVLMRQALSNLLQNAAEAMPGGGTLTVELREGNRELMIVIKDTGVGIRRETLKKIFLPFFTTKDTGVGMGLALAHKFVTSHGGRIDVVSKEGMGTTFTVVLPRA